MKFNQIRNERIQTINQYKVIFLVTKEILVNGQGLKPVIKRQKTLTIYDLDQLKYHLPNPRLFDMQHYIRFDVRSRDNRKRANILANGY